MNKLMKAAFFESHGGPQVLKYGELPRPEPGYGQVRVRLVSASINHLDIWVRRGLPGLRLKMPHILGGDGAGWVDLCGPGCRRWNEGDPVILHPGVSDPLYPSTYVGLETLSPNYRILGEHIQGTHAEYICVPEENLFSKPDILSWDEAAGLGLVFTTAYEMVKKAGRLEGKTVLVHAAGSGVSSALIQLCKLLGANVIATASHVEKLSLATSLGAEHTIDYKKCDFYKECKSLTDGRGPDVIFDHVGRDTWEANIKSVAWGGKIILCGATTGNKVTTDLAHVFYRQIQILGSTMGSKGDFPTVLKLFETGRLRCVVGARLSLSEIVQAHELLENRKAIGKIVLQVCDPTATNAPS